MENLKIFIILLIIAGVSFAEEVPVRYTLEDCLQIGRERSIYIANAGRDEAISKTQIKQARSEALPHLSLNGEYRRLDELQSIQFGDGTDPVEMGLLDNYSATVEMRQLIYSGGRVNAALNAARATKRYAAMNMAEAEAVLDRDIRIGFNDILLAKKAVSVYEESIKQLQSLLDQTQLKYDNGAASEFDLITAKVRLANEKPLLIMAANQLELIKENFRRTLNLEEDVFDLDGALDLAPVDTGIGEYLSAASENRSMIKVLEAQVAMREEAVAAARSRQKPNVSLFATYNGANSYAFVAFQEDWQTHWNAGVMVNWNVWDGGLTGGGVEQALIELDKTRAALEDYRKIVELEIKQSYLAMTHANESVNSGKGNIELAEKALEIARARHDSGLATYLDFTDANVALSRARLSYFTAMHDHANAVVRLTFASGLGR